MASQGQTLASLHGMSVTEKRSFIILTLGGGSQCPGWRRIVACSQFQLQIYECY
jgi:hypothetical protein